MCAVDTTPKHSDRKIVQARADRGGLVGVGQPPKGGSSQLRVSELPWIEPTAGKPCERVNLNGAALDVSPSELISNGDTTLIPDPLCDNPPKELNLRRAN